MLTLFLVALVAGGVIQRFTQRLLLTAGLGFLGYVAWSIVREFMVPYAGGGASFWPIDIFFAGPVAAVGAGTGGAISAWLVPRK